MRSHIDWLTFTFTPLWINGGESDYPQCLAEGLREQVGMKLWVDIFDGEWKHHDHGRAPYVDGWALENVGVTLFASPTLTHATVEISGTGCEEFISRGYMETVLLQVKDRVTRIDIACDIETTVGPNEFALPRTHDRMKSHAHIVSETGETVYVGSQKSDRFARAYRFNSPHPRCHLLRIEHIFRRDYAKKVANTCVEGGLLAVVRASGVAFGWSHAIWRPDVSEDVDISLVNDNHKGNNTVFWFVDTVAPCFKRLCREGVIKNPEEFLTRYFRET